jgi:hypothetical protein
MRPPDEQEAPVSDRASPDVPVELPPPEGSGGPPAKRPAPPNEPVVVRPMPKVVFFYLTWLASLVFGIIASASHGMPAHLGTVWMCIFAFNVLVISFDFTEMVSITAIAVALTIVFAGLYFDFLGFIGEFFRNLDVEMNAGFYFCVFGLFSIMYAAVFLRSRFEYWEFRHNEVLHRTGLFGEIKRYSTEDLRWFKEIPDVLERILLKSGRMVLTTPRETHPIVIEHVLGIEGADERIAELLGTKKVTFT